MSVESLAVEPEVTSLDVTTSEVAAPEAARAVSAHPERNLSPREELLAFLHQLELRVPQRPSAVELIGSRGGEGTSTVTRELACCAASRGTAVALVQLSRHQPAADPAATDPAARPQAALIADLEQLESLLEETCRGQQRGLPVELVLSPAAVAALHDSRPERDRLVRALKQRFELVLLDAPAALAANDGVLLAPSVDGVVLVVEAEVTRRPVAQAAVERIRDTGAPLVGLLFNKRRHHIPEAVYRLL